MIKGGRLVALLKRNAKSEKTGSIIGSDAFWEGAVQTGGSVRIDGRFKGSVKAEGDIVVGEDALVEAELHGKYILIAGSVWGEVTAAEKLELGSKGKLYGDFQADKLLVEEGAVLCGECRMDLDAGDMPGAASGEAKMTPAFAEGGGSTDPKKPPRQPR